MKNKLVRSLLVVLVLALGWGVYYINGLIPIVTGYAAKNMASGIFVANRTQESLEAIDLNFSLIRYVRNTVDYKRKEVTSRFLWGSSKAIYIEGFGCILVREVDEQTIRNRPYTRVPLPAVNPDSVVWPAGDKLTTVLPQGIDTVKLNRAIARALHDTVGNKVTFAVAVAYKDQLVAEKYHQGFSANNRFLSWSMAKSFTNALAGVMAQDGRIRISDHPDIPQWKKDGRSAITINNLMHMNSGLEWNEDYGARSSVNIMLHEKADMGAYAASFPLRTPPDSVWYYSSGTTNIVMQHMRHKLRNDSLWFAYPRRALFNPLGMRSAIFEPDASGTFAGSSYLYATMRDYVRFGLLYLHQGNWLGRQLFPEGWVSYTTQPAKGSGGKYGAFFWLNKSGEFPALPRDMFMCKGHDGQGIYIIPSLQMVIVRTGFSKKPDFDFNRFLTEIVASVQQ